jgi:hypothetical protein
MVRVVISILLTLAVAFANGACPCGLALVMGDAGGVKAKVDSVKQGRCPDCQSDGDRGTQPDHDQSAAEKCARTVSGNLPTAGVELPAVDFVAVAFVLPVLQPAVLANCEYRAASDVRGAPPPTLLNLSCCFTT